jgi:hypothetical protein
MRHSSVSAPVGGGTFASGGDSVGTLTMAIEGRKTESANEAP